MRLFILLIFFVFMYSLNAIPIDVDLSFEEDYAALGAGYSEMDSDRYNLQKVSVEYEQLGSTWFDLDDGKITVSFLGEPFSIKTISEVSGEVYSFDYPSVNSNISYSFDTVKFNKLAPYILDEYLNTIWIWSEPSESWLDIRDEYSVPDGDILEIYFFDELLHLVIFDGSLYSIWHLSNEFEKIDELEEAPETIVYYTKDSIILNKNFVKKIGSDFQKVYYGINEASIFYPAFTGDGVLLSMIGSASVELVWYSFLDNSLTKIYNPKVAEEWKGCGNYSMSEMHCMFQTGPHELAIYKLADGEFKLDSVFSFNDESIDLRGVSLFSVYGKTRIIKLQLEEENSSHLLELSPTKSRIFSSTPDGQYHFYLGLSVLDNKNYFVRSSEVGVEINRYDIEGSTEIVPLVLEDEYPEFRVMEIESSSSRASGSGSMPIYLLVMLLTLLSFSVRRRPSLSA